MCFFEKGVRLYFLEKEIASFQIIQERSYAIPNFLERLSFQDVRKKKVWFSMQRSHLSLCQFVVAIFASQHIHTIFLTIWHLPFLEFWLVDTWSFAHWPHQRAVTHLENVRQLNIRRGKNLGFQLSYRQPPWGRLMNEITLFSFIQTKVLLISFVGKSCNIAEKGCDLWKKNISKSRENFAKAGCNFFEKF